jgi:uncharacterized protein
MSELQSFSEDECWRRLEELVVGRVGFDMGRGLRIHPVNFAVHDRTIVVRTDPASELARCVELFADGATVAFEVDHIDLETHTGWSVLVGGRVSEVDDPAEADRISGNWPPEPWPTGNREMLVRITPVEVTGRRLD